MPKMLSNTEGVMKKLLDRRPLSWSAISSFRYDKEQWYKRYYLGEKQDENGKMRFGKWAGTKLAEDPTFQPDVPRATIYEYELRTKIGDIPCIGFIDSYNPEKKILLEYKTAEKSWDKEKAENHGQLRMYALMLMLQDKVKPEELDINLVSMQTEENNDFTFSFVKDMKPVIHPVKLTTRDCLLFGAELLQTVKEMEEYVQQK